MRRLSINDLAKAGLKTGKRAYISLAAGLFLAIFLITVMCLSAQGIFLAERQEKTSIGTSIELTLLKLVAQPLIVWYFAFYVFDMPPLWAKSAVVLSALPTGTGPFMLAELYGKGRGIASRTIFLSTLFGIVTLAVWLTFL